LAEHERVALAIIALITGMMGFIVSMIAVPAASTDSSLPDGTELRWSPEGGWEEVEEDEAAEVGQTS